MKLVGYTSSRPFGGFVMPVPAQNSCLREYSVKFEATYKLPQLEHKYKNCYMQLFTSLNFLKKNDGIVMYSLLMMPKKNKLKTFFKILKNKNNSVHFVLENFFCKTINEFEEKLISYEIKELVISRKILKSKFKNI